jgi:hypothetical protein
VLARTLGLGEVTDSLDELRETLDLELGYAGLRRVPANESAFVYDDVVFQWMAQGRLEFNAGSLRAACKNEGLLGAADRVPLVFGVKSFLHPIDLLEERCTQVLDLTAHNVLHA